MRQKFDTISNFFAKKDIFATLFIIVLIASWLTHASFRNDHFQEPDSAGTYPTLYEFPQSALRSVALMYPPGHLFSEDTARKILDNPTVKKIRETSLAGMSDQFLIDNLTKTSPLAAFRYGLIQAVAAANLPFAFQGFFAMALGSTYSSGSGFAYSLFSGPDTSYADFMSRSMLISITLFHISILLLFLIMSRLSISRFLCVSVSLIALFSISLYSSGIHIGSTVWNITSELLWLWYLIKNAGHPKLLKRISWMTGILVFFNYLILFFWLAFMLKQLIESMRSGSRSVSSILRWSWNMAKSQRVAIALIFVCGVLFFQPGQGFRGSTELSQLPSDAYHIALNFFSWHANNAFADIIQIIVCVFFLIGMAVFFRTKSDSDESNLMRHILGYMCIMYVILVFMKTLSFIPTRHILFMTPILFIAGAAGIHRLIGKYAEKTPRPIALSALIALSIIGFCVIRVRQADALDRTRDIRADNDVALVGVYDASYNILYSHDGEPAPVVFINPKLFEAGKTYLYVSQAGPFANALAEWQREYDIEFAIAYEYNDINPTYFIAHNPDFERLRYSRPNSLYQAKFRIISIKKR